MRAQGPHGMKRPGNETNADPDPQHLQAQRMVNLRLSCRSLFCGSQARDKGKGQGSEFGILVSLRTCFVLIPLATKGAGAYLLHTAPNAWRLTIYERERLVTQALLPPKWKPSHPVWLLGMVHISQSLNPPCIKHPKPPGIPRHKAVERQPVLCGLQKSVSSNQLLRGE
ncbi:hypothetical protein NMY22_g12370 [Coprinellus aureogranulatus]|nr:hypothetical protein NMY22_g12370 [Coprinellus aureogranulatus]